MFQGKTGPHPSGYILRAGRHLFGWRLLDLSRRSGLSIAYLSLIERGLRRPSQDAARRIAEALSTGRGGGQP